MRVRVNLLGGRTLESPASKGAQSAAAALWVNGGAGGHAAEQITRYCSMWGMSFDAACGFCLTPTPCTLTLNPDSLPLHPEP